MKKTSLVFALPLLLGACLVDVRHVADPGPEFEKARAEVRDLASSPGPAKSVQVMAYDPGDQELVRVGVPLWIAHKAAGKDHEIDLEDELDGKLRDRLGRIRLDDLEKVGRGAMVEVEEEDGARVLVWLR